MKVTVKGNVKQTISYGEVGLGQCFINAFCKGHVFIKTDRDGVNGSLSVCLKSGRGHSWAHDAPGFEIADAEVVVHG